jgi:hypothetical protein
MSSSAASPSLLSAQLTIRPGRSRDGAARSESAGPIRSESRSESNESIRVSRPDPSQPARSGPRRDPSPNGRSESAGLIRVVLHDPSRSESAGLIRVVLPDPSRFPSPPLPPVRSSHDGHRSPVHYLKGARGDRALGGGRWRSKRGAFECNINLLCCHGVMP